MKQNVPHTMTSFSPHLSPRYPRILTPRAQSSRAMRDAGMQTAFASQMLSQARAQMLQGAASQALRDLQALSPSERAASQGSGTQNLRAVHKMAPRLDAQSTAPEHEPVPTHANHAQMKALGGLSISPLLVENTLLQDLQQSAKGSVMVTAVSPSEMPGWRQRTLHDAGTQMTHTVATQTPQEPRARGSRCVSTQTRFDLRSDKTTATVHDRRTQTGHSLQRATLGGPPAPSTPSDRRTQTEAQMSRRVTRASVPSSPYRRTVSYDSDTQTMPSNRKRSWGSRARGQWSR